MLRRFKYYFNDNPLQVALLLGMTVRLLAALLAKGYGMHDDHFLVIESAGSWVGGYDYNAWLPSSPSYTGAQGHSLFYPGLMYLLLEFLQWSGVTDPQTQMLVIRLLHAAYSLLVISIGFSIGNKLGGKKTGGAIAILLALFWFMPALSVRNLVEMVCIPPLLAATLFFMDGEEKKHWGWFAISAAFLGLSMSIRYQTAVFALGFGLILLFRKQFRDTIVFTIVTFFIFILTQSTDLFVHGKFMAEFQSYVEYNISARHDYISSPWYTYILTIGGLLLPPISLFLLWGYFRGWKKSWILFLPPLLFLIFHSIFPNKQERFILPAIPFIIILGYACWYEYRKNSVYWSRHLKFLKYSWIFFWSLNILALLVISSSYSKKSRVEAMHWMYRQGDLVRFIAESTHREDLILPPQFYTGNWNQYIPLVKHVDLTHKYHDIMDLPEETRPNYVVFFEDQDLEERVRLFEETMGSLDHQVTIEPGNLDKLLHWLNPRNRIERYHIYRIHSFHQL